MKSFEVEIERTRTCDGKTYHKQNTIEVNAETEEAAKIEALDLACDPQIRMFGDTGMASGSYQVRVVQIKEIN